MADTCRSGHHLLLDTMSRSNYYYSVGAIVLLASVIFGIKAYDEFASGEHFVGGACAWAAIVLASFGNAVILRGTE